MSNHQFSVSLKLIENYLFQIDFGEFGDLLVDEPAPLGHGEGPNPTRLLAASVANCLAASLLFAIRKHQEDPGELKAIASGQLERVDQRWRVTSLNVDLQLGKNAASIPHLQQALEKFEDFCVVTQSVRAGIDVHVTIRDASNTQLNVA